MSTTTGQFTVDLDLRDGYAFNVEFPDGGGPPLVVDEPPPLAKRTGRIRPVCSRRPSAAA